MTVSESFLLHSPAQVNIQLIHESPPPLPVAHRYSLHSPAMVHSHIIHLGYIHSIKLTRVHIGNKAASVVMAQNQKQRKYISMIPLVRCNVVAVPVENSTTSLWSDTRLATSLWSDTHLATSPWSGTHCYLAENILFPVFLIFDITWNRTSTTTKYQQENITVCCNIPVQEKEKDFQKISTSWTRQCPINWRTS